MHILPQRMCSRQPLAIIERVAASLSYSTLSELVDSQKRAEVGAKFCYQNGLLFRLWCPDANNDHIKACERLYSSSIVLQQCWAAVFQIAHEAGHLGINKTRSRVLCRYYWPGVFKDVANHCQSCKICQRSPGEIAG